MATLINSRSAVHKVICGLRSSASPVIWKSSFEEEMPHIVAIPIATPQTMDSLQRLAVSSTGQGMLQSLLLSKKKGITVSSRRFAHTNVRFPNFDKYRVGDTRSGSEAVLGGIDSNRFVPSAIYYGVGGVISLLAAKEVVQTVVTYKAMAADQKALASIEIKMDDIPEGQTKTFEWRGKPIFVKHRTDSEIAREKAVQLSELRHPEHDDERVQKDEWSIVIGVCTHLGCVPIAGAGDYGGYYCPCHGSHYDGSGRIRKGPAPLNLHVPAYNFRDDVIVVGSS
ncbi:hypothetical protein AB6A40_001385 [Gnathostoma spinigerum]|uniref:Rieske domain-containing protein n=1 Tax=Gnathostoma spinigerum TaxID=75299 RepID=A0ABD6E5B9_9BILA